MSPKPSRRKSGLPMWVVVLVLVLLLAGGAGGYYAANQPKNGVRLERLEADAREKLPAGTDKEKVPAWFAAHGITDFGDLTNTGGGKIGYRALVPNDTYMERAELDISFKYDKDGKVTESRFERVVAR